VTACCNNVELWAAALIGFLGCLVYVYTKKLLVRFEIDDPLEITQKNGICGLFSIIAAGIFDKDDGFIRTGDSVFLFTQIRGSIFLICLGGFMSFIFFYTLKKLDKLRISPLFEILGVDFISTGANGENTLNQKKLGQFILQ